MCAAELGGVRAERIYRWRNQFGGLKAEDAKRLQGARAGERHIEASAGRCGAAEGSVEGDCPGGILSPDSDAGLQFST